MYKINGHVLVGRLRCIVKVINNKRQDFKTISGYSFTRLHVYDTDTKGFYSYVKKATFERNINLAGVHLMSLFSRAFTSS